MQQTQRYELIFALEDTTAACFHVREISTGKVSCFHSRATAQAVTDLLNARALRWELCS